MKLILEFKGETLKKFVKFLEIIDANKNESVGILLNINLLGINVIYTYVDAEDEGENFPNYYYYEPFDHPYIFFDYAFRGHLNEPLEIFNTISELIVIKSNLKNENSNVINEINPLEPITVKMKINDFKDFFELVKNVATENDDLLIKAIPWGVGQQRRNVFHLQKTSSSGNEIIEDLIVNIYTPKFYYKIFGIELCPKYCFIFLGGFDGYKEIANKWSNKILKKEKKKTYFFIKLNYVTQSNSIKVEFILDKDSEFHFIHPYGFEEEHLDYSKFYMIDSESFMKIFKNFKNTNYNEECQIIYTEDMIRFFFATTGQKDKTAGFKYSSYQVRLNATMKNHEEVLAIQETEL